MNYFIIVLFIASLIGTDYKVIQGVTYADFISAITLIAVLIKGNFCKYNKDAFFHLSFVYIILMSIASLLNFTFTDTQFVNYYRIMVEGLIAYTSINVALEKNKHLLFFSYCLVLYSIYFLIKRQMALTTGLEEDIYYFATFDRNEIAFSNLLLIIGLLFVYFKAEIKFNKIILLLIPIMVFNIFFNASRFSVISLVIYVIFMMYWIGIKITARRIFSIGMLVILFYSVFDLLMGSFDFSLIEGSSDMLSNKLQGDELKQNSLQMRLWELNIKHIIDWIFDSEINILQILIGDGLSLTHGIFSQTFCSTGFFGFIYYCSSHWNYIVRRWKISHASRYAAFLVFIMFLNDIITNSHFIVNVNTILYMGLVAYITSMNNKLQIQ